MTCRACGVSLGGTTGRRERRLAVILASGEAIGGTYCMEHYELLEERIRETLVEVAEVATRSLAGVRS